MPSCKVLTKYFRVKLLQTTSAKGQMRTWRRWKTNYWGHNLSYKTARHSYGCSICWWWMYHASSWRQIGLAIWCYLSTPPPPPSPPPLFSSLRPFLAHWVTSYPCTAHAEAEELSHCFPQCLHVGPLCPSSDRYWPGLSTDSVMNKCSWGASNLQGAWQEDEEWQILSELSGFCLCQPALTWTMPCRRRQALNTASVSSSLRLAKADRTGMSGTCRPSWPLTAVPLLLVTRNISTGVTADVIVSIDRAENLMVGKVILDSMHGTSVKESKFC